MLIKRRSPFSGKEHTLDVPCTKEQLDAWMQGEYIQDAMPDISADHREFILTGITPEEWENAFGNSEDVFAGDDDSINARNTAFDNVKGSPQPKTEHKTEHGKSI
jgi:hypothetical protein